MKFETTLPTDPAYTEFAAMLDAARKPKITGFDYQGVVDHYNLLPVGAIFSFPFPKSKEKYLVSRLKVAGLVEPTDYQLLMDNEEQEDKSEVMTAYFTKRSKAQGGKLPVAGQHKPKKTEEAAEVTQQSEPEPEIAPVPPAVPLPSAAPAPAAKKTPAKTAAPVKKTPAKPVVVAKTAKPARRSPPKA